MKVGDIVKDGDGTTGTVRDVRVREEISYAVINGKRRPRTTRHTEIYVDWHVRGTSR